MIGVCIIDHFSYICLQILKFLAEVLIMSRFSIFFRFFTVPFPLFGLV